MQDAEIPTTSDSRGSRQGKPGSELLQKQLQQSRRPVQKGWMYIDLGAVSAMMYLEKLQGPITQPSLIVAPAQPRRSQFHQLPPGSKAGSLLHRERLEELCIFHPSFVSSDSHGHEL